MPPPVPSHYGYLSLVPLTKNEFQARSFRELTQTLLDPKSTDDERRGAIALTLRLAEHHPDLRQILFFQ